MKGTSAQRVYNKSGDIYLVQELLGHKNISTTQKYLGVNYADAKAAVEAIALITESDRNYKMSSSRKQKGRLNSSVALFVKGKSFIF